MIRWYRAERATVEYDTNQWTPAKIAEVRHAAVRLLDRARLIWSNTQEIEDMGFDAEPIEASKADTVVLQIYGMT